MSVELQSFIQGPAERVPEPRAITNVVATLRGSQPESANRYYVVSGHYDSRCSDRSTRCVTHPGPTTTHRAWPPCSSWPG